jgi:hypothetical protein
LTYSTKSPRSHHQTSPIIKHHQASSHIIKHHHTSAIINHNQTSSHIINIIKHHQTSSHITHYQTSSIIITPSHMTHHHPSSHITNHQTSSLITHQPPRVSWNLLVHGPKSRLPLAGTLFRTSFAKKLR